MNEKTGKYFTEEVIEQLRQAIKNNGGNEVFFAGQIDDKGIVVSVNDACHGNEHSVPVHRVQERNCSVLIHNHPGGNLQPSDADIGVASRSSENAQGFYIINNEVSEVFIVVQAVPPKVIKKLDEEGSGEFLSTGGPLSELSKTFEERPVQVKLVKNIARAFNQNSIGVFEAGTGVGKSYAYLIPALIWAIQNQERIVISTGTINLQQQLCEKDIPMAEKIIGREVKFLLMKGRQNYVCRRRFEDASAQRELFGDDTEIYDRLREWINASPTGSRSDLSFMPSNEIWTRINSESDACMGGRCPYYTECFVMKVRKEALGANILVVNHHLLFADIQTRMNSGNYDDASVLPPYRRIIFDEAHGIENAATSFFSESFNRFKILKQINQLYRKRKSSESGFLCTLAILSSNEEKALLAYECVSRIKNDLLNLELCASDLLSGEYNMRLHAGTARAFGPLITLSQTLSNSLGEFTGYSRQVMEGIAEEDREIPAYWESKVILRRLEDVCMVLHDFAVWEEKQDLVFWIQKSILSPEYVKDQDNNFVITFTETPLDIAPLMASGVYEPMESVVCTSATLKTGRSFDYWMRRVGVSFAEKERVLFGEYPSPFPYGKNMLFAVPKDAPMPDEMNFQSWVEMALAKLIDSSDGRTLVLFTSYESLKNAYNNVPRRCVGFQGTFMRQGEDDSSRLLENFKKDISSVLFATDSFWQGVDVPGESLSQVIIVKLPFTVPKDPVFTARSEAIAKKGGNSFMELSVPEAVIKFRQGTGRLMRRSSDKGAVIVLDRRVYEKRYGSVFLASLPECKKMYEPLDKICDAVSDVVFN